MTKTDQETCSDAIPSVVYVPTRKRKRKSNKRSKKCVICYNHFTYNVDEVDLTDRFPTLFHKVCNDCVPSCTLCGDDAGWSKSALITGEHCGSCERAYCKSCGINITCNDCHLTACEDCMDNDFEDKNEAVCVHMKPILEALRTKGTIEE